MTIREEHVAAAAAAYLETLGYEVYQEVGLSFEMKGTAAGALLGDARADIVAVRKWAEGDDLKVHVVVVEAKLTISFELLAQLRRWKGFAHGIFAAVPRSDRGPGRREAEHVLAHCYKVGLFETDGDRVVEKIASPPYEIESVALLASLRQGHKTAARAGSNGGKQYTSYRETCENLARYVGEHHGCTLQEAVVGIEHHYASNGSACSALDKMLKKELVPGVVRAWKGRLWPKGLEPGAIVRGNLPDS